MRLIDADALKAELGDQRLDNDFCICGDESTIRDFIDDAPTIEAEPVRHGKWITRKSEPGEMIDCCSRCKYPVSHFWHGEYQYCPSCGAKMDMD